jgi:hypothetical protein
MPLHVHAVFAEQCAKNLRWQPPSPHLTAYYIDWLIHVWHKTCVAPHPADKKSRVVEPLQTMFQNQQAAAASTSSSSSSGASQQPPPPPPPENVPEFSWACAGKCVICGPSYPRNCLLLRAEYVWVTWSGWLNKTTYQLMSSVLWKMNNV